MKFFFSNNKIYGIRRKLVLIKWFNKVKAVTSMYPWPSMTATAPYIAYMFKGEN